MANDLKKDSFFFEIKEKGFFMKEPLVSFPMFAFGLWRSGYYVDIWPYSMMSKNRLVTLSYKISKNPIARLSWLLWRLLVCSGIIDMPSNKFKFIFALLIKYFSSLFPHKLKKSFAGLVQKRSIKNNYIVSIEVAVPKHYLERYRNIKFYDIAFNIPFDTEGYLKYKYGENWKIPRKKWDWHKEDGAVINDKSK